MDSSRTANQQGTGHSAWSAPSVPGRCIWTSRQQPCTYKATSEYSSPEPNFIKIMLNRIKLPAKQSCHLYILWLIFCSFLLSKKNGLKDWCHNCCTNLLSTTQNYLWDPEHEMGCPVYNKMKRDVRFNCMFLVDISFQNIILSYLVLALKSTHTFFSGSALFQNEVALPSQKMKFQRIVW